MCASAQPAFIKFGRYMGVSLADCEGFKRCSAVDVQGEEVQTDVILFGGL